MKKSNVTIIAAALIIIHAVIFMALIGNKGDKKLSKTQTPPARTSPISEPELPDFEVPDVQIPEAPPLAPMPDPVVMPVEIVEMKPAAPRETIATTSVRPGHLRADRPNKRTRQVYQELKNDPYQSAIVVDARTGKILYENRAAVYSYPASITKLMTMLLALEQIDAGKISLNDRVKITPEIAGIGGSGVYLDVRESGEFTVENMLQALMIHSANDAAAALAVHTAGSIDAFVDMMNEKARQLGMNSTTYHSPHGLPPGNGQQPDISTAYDIAILSLAALRHPHTLDYTSIKLAYLPLSSIRTEKFMLANRNALVGKNPYQGCDGLKTGYHNAGGSSLTATAKRGNNRVVAVILGCPNKNIRDAEVRKLLDKGFAALENQSI
ncbi:D-alanyl-D-alanine carboxypeptidase [Pontiellaceae bacterium B12219]|nr:D-alanyl-D-alanine carboxypeptidase [Pontiellaceae bacterium B12219]